MPSDLTFCAAHRDWLIEFIEALVAIESPSDDPAAVNRCGDELSARLASMGGAVTRLPSATAGDHVRASFGNNSNAVTPQEIMEERKGRKELGSR